MLFSSNFGLSSRSALIPTINEKYDFQCFLSYPYFWEIIGDYSVYALGLCQHFGCQPQVIDLGTHCV